MLSQKMPRRRILNTTKWPFQIFWDSVQTEFMIWYREVRHVPNHATSAGWSTSISIKTKPSDTHTILHHNTYLFPLFLNVLELIVCFLKLDMQLISRPGSPNGRRKLLVEKVTTYSGGSICKYLWPVKLHVSICLSFNWVAINMTFVHMSSKCMLTLTSVCTATVTKQ